MHVTTSTADARAANDCDAHALRHVVVVNDRAVPRGGASTVALRSAAALANRGVAVTLFAGGTEVWSELEAAGVRTVLTPTAEIGDEAKRLQAAASVLWNAQAARRLRELLEASPSGGVVAHVHSWGKGLSPSIFAAVRRAGVPLVATLHDYGFVCPNAGLHVFPTGQPCDLRPMSLACVMRRCDARSHAHKLWRIARQISLEHVARAAQAADRLIAVTDYAAEIYRPLLPRDSRLAVLANPIDATDVGPAPVEANADFVFVGRLSREKGALVFAEAASRLGVAPVFVGDGGQADEIRARCPQAIITGWLDRAAVTARIRSARAVVMPALWRETQGMVVPEAMANGVPVIASSGTAPASAVRDGETGLIFANGVSASLAQAMARLGDAGLAARLGHAAYDAYWKSPANMTRHVDGLLAIYEEAIARRR